MKKFLLILCLLLFSTDLNADIVACSCDPYCVGKIFDLNKMEWNETKVSESIMAFEYDASQSGIGEGTIYWQQPDVEEYKKIQQAKVITFNGSDYDTYYSQRLISFISIMPHGSPKVWTYFPREKMIIETKANSFQDFSYGHLIIHRKCEEITD